MTDFHFQTTISVLVQHINYGNHLGHDALVSLLHEARVRAFAAKGKDERCLLVKTLHVEYIKEAFLHDELTFTITGENEGPCSARLTYSVHRDDKLIATAYTQLVFFDYTRKKIIRGALP